MRDAIKRRINELLASGDPNVEWLKAAVREHDFLPLYLGWVAVIGLRPDATFVRWDHESEQDIVEPLIDAYWERLALCAAVTRYPELASLVPARPSEARTCERCGGNGQLEGLQQVMCACGGLGWLLPGEPRPSSAARR